MATMRFSLAEVALRETVTGAWIRTIADCLGIRMFSKMNPLGGYEQRRLGCNQAEGNTGSSSLCCQQLDPESRNLSDEVT